MPSTIRHTALSRAAAPGVPLSAPGAGLPWAAIDTSSAPGPVPGPSAASAMFLDVRKTGCRKHTDAVVKARECEPNL